MRTDPVSRSLGLAMQARRHSLGLSMMKAANLAGLNRATWTTAERATRALRQYNYSAVERALGWSPGSVEQILSGGEPTVADRAAPVKRAAVAESAVIQFGDLQVRIIIERRSA